MKKKILLILVMLLAVGLLLPSYAFYESGDLTTQNTVVHNQSQAEMDAALAAAGCDNMETIYSTVASMNASDASAYLAAQAALMSQSTGCNMEFVFNMNGTVYSSNPGDTVYVSQIDTDFVEAYNKYVAALKDGHEDFLGIYDMGSTKPSNSTLDDDEEEEEHTHVPNSYNSSTPGHVHSHPDEGTPGVNRDPTPFTANVETNTRKNLLNVGGSFTVSGNKHILRSFNQSIGHPIGICPTIYYTWSTSCIYCYSYQVSVTGACAYQYSYTVYGTPTYTDLYHGLTISFEGFIAEGGATSISGETRSAYGSFPAEGETTYSSSFVVKELIPSELKYDSETGFSYGTVIATCSCGESKTYKIYFDLMSKPKPVEEGYSLTVVSDGGGLVGIGNEALSDRVTKEKIIINDSSNIKAEAYNGYEFIGWYQLDGKKYSSKPSVTVVQPGYDYTLIAKFGPEKPKNIYSVTVYSDGNGIVGINDVWSNHDNQMIIATVEEDDTVSICSTPDDEYTIDYWAKIEDGVERFFTNDEDFRLTVDKDYVFIAHFKTEGSAYKVLTVTHDGNGYTIGGTKYAITGKKYPIWSFPNPGYEFDRWEDNLAVDGLTTLAQNDFVIMPFKNYTVKAYFVPDDTSDRSTLEIISDGNGTVYIDDNEPDLIDSINDKNGSEHDIHAIPDEGYKFENWKDIEGNIIFDKTDERIILNEDVTYIAHFIPLELGNTFRLDVESDGNGTVTGGTEFAEPEKEYRITADPDDGYKFDYWEKKTTEEDGSDISEKTNLSINTYFKMPAKDVTLIAHFKKIEEEVVLPEPKFLLTVESSDGGYNEGDHSGEYCEGDHITVEAHANSGYRFLEWQDESGNKVSQNSNYSFYMPAFDYTIISIFVEDPYNNSENISLQIVSIRDIRWKDYFTGNSSYSYRYLNIPASIENDEVLLDEVDLDDDSYEDNREIVYGYAVENRIQTTGLKATDDLGLRIKYKLYGDGTDITDEVYDPNGYLKLDFYHNNDNSSFLTSTTVKSEDTILWSWVTYLPLDLTTDNNSKLLYEKYNKITVEYDIKVIKNGRVLYDYIEAINSRSEGKSKWRGKVFTYRTDKTLLDDIYDNSNS